jgi:hypothetical protein
VLWIPDINAHAVRRGWENDRRHQPEKARMDAQGRKDPRSLRNCYLTEGPEEIALAVPSRSGSWESWCREGARKPRGAHRPPKQTKHTRPLRRGKALHR